VLAKQCCIRSCESTARLKWPIATNPSVTQSLAKTTDVTRYLSTRRL